jgi:hypothetical protein
LPDDGNKYELVRGELFVTPPPTLDHETTTARLTRRLDPLVAAHRLGLIYHPKAVMRFEGSEVEPDLMVRQPGVRKATNWDSASVPSLVVEVLSPSTDGAITARSATCISTRALQSTGSSTPSGRRFARFARIRKIASSAPGSPGVRPASLSR